MIGKSYNEATTYYFDATQTVHTGGSRMNARIGQLVARYLGKGFAMLAVYLGMKLSEGQISSVVEPIAAGVAAVAGIVIDLLLHKWQEKFKISTNG